MAFWVYLLRCRDGSFYAGHTDDLDTRISQHLIGRGCDHTARRQPVTFAWAQDFPSRIEALEAERRIKGWSRAKKEALIAGDWERVSQLARSGGAGASTSSARTVEGDTTAIKQSTPIKDTGRPPSVRPELVEGHAKSDTLTP